MSTTDKTNIPTYTDGEVVTWLGSYGTIPGILAETLNYFERNGDHQMLFTHGAVALHNGRVCVPDPTTIQFIRGIYKDKAAYTGSNRCPPTAARLSAANAGRGDSAASLNPPLTPVSTVSADDRDFIVAPHKIAEDNAALARSLAKVVENAVEGPELIEAANGNGLKFLKLLEDLGNQATGTDIALVTNDFANHVSKGVPELTLANLVTYLKLYNRKRRQVPPDERPKASVEVQTISQIAFKASEIRDIWEIKTEAADAANAAPTTMAEATKILMKILKNRLGAQKLDQGEEPDARPVLAATCVPAEPNASTMRDEITAEILAALARDPKKYPKKDYGLRQGRRQGRLVGLGAS